MLYKNYFAIDEFLVDKQMEYLPKHVVDKIVTYHLPVLNSIRHAMGIPVTISQNSGFRPFNWEQANGRSGDSQHTFGDLGGVHVRKDVDAWKGAVDLTCSNMLSLMERLRSAGEQGWGYTRICLYPKQKFVHCDFKNESFQEYTHIGGIGWKKI